MASEEPTLGELMRRFERFELHVDAKFREVLSSNVYQRDYDHLEGRIGALEERLRWVIRTIAAAVIPMVVGAIVAMLTIGAR